MKVAKLVTISLITRVIVEEGAPNTTIAYKAQSQFIDKIREDLMDNIESIEDDLEVPFGTLTEDYQCSAHS